ncbi:MAG: glycosyltransferase family 4 protein [Nostocales cyanobacterium]|nr:MAG: glycosyltransferase family 4 protein [Nostocales cyanobacterium]TAF09368.1 MAG: glycosyltransferase family 4 protein [Nostocales cyanobacterium]
MENITQLGTQITEQTHCPDILIMSRIFKPQGSVIGEYVYNRCLQDPDRIIVITSGCSNDKNNDKNFEQPPEFPVYHCLNYNFPKNFLGGNLVSRLIKTCLKSSLKIFNIIFSFLLAIKLYFRYHYRYIEWCHGYDFLALLLLSYILPIRFFIYLHGKDLTDIAKTPFWRSLFKLTLKRAEGIVCQNSYVRDKLRNTFRLDTPTHIINPVVRPDKFTHSSSTNYLQDLRTQLRESYNISETAIVILSVGELLPNKGFEQVIDNIPLLLTLGIDVHYIICGQGHFETELKSQCQRLRVDKRVHFAGYVSEKELANYYAACDIFAILTLEEEINQSIENLEIFHLEAEYFGKPIIASRLGSILDIVHHEENGLLVNPESGYEVLQAFKKLCQDQQLREKLGRQGQELAKRKTYHRWLYNPETSYSCIVSY